MQRRGAAPVIGILMCLYVYFAFYLYLSFVPMYILFQSSLSCFAMGRRGGGPGEEVLGRRRVHVVYHDSRAFSSSGREVGEELGGGVGCGDAAGLEVPFHCTRG